MAQRLRPPRVVRGYREAIVASLCSIVFLCLAGGATAADFVSPNDGSNHIYSYGVAQASYSFTVNGIFSHKYTEWYVNGN